MFKVLLVLSSMARIYSIPVEHTSDDSVLSTLNFGDMANLMMSTDAQISNLKTGEQRSGDVHSSHVFEASKDLLGGAVVLPIRTAAEAGAVGGKISAVSAVTGSVKGSAIATPIILKAVALPGIAAGATAAFMSVPNFIAESANRLPQLAFNNVKTSVEGTAHNFANLFILEELRDETENDTSVDLISNGMENVAQTVDVLKAGALGLAAKGLVAGKKAASAVRRVMLKPIAIFTGVPLKMFGSGLIFGGKLVAGTGVNIAKAGTAIKFAGLGGIGLGASAISWGLDKSTIETHFQESDRKFNL